MTILGNQPTDPVPDPPDGPVDREAPRRRRRIVLAWIGGVVGLVLLGTYVVFPGQVLRTLGLRDGDYSFIFEMAGEPVTWDHCRAIRYQVNPENAPEDWSDIVSGAIKEVERDSGFVFADRGTTRRRDLLYFANAYEPEPVLIMWSLPGEDIRLAGDTLGLGGGTPVPMGDRWRFAFGKVILDSTDVEPLEGMSAHRVQQLLLEHELAHVLGLDHVGDPSELMYSEFRGQHGFGPGDRAGLRRLHDVPCG